LPLVALMNSLPVPPIIVAFSAPPIVSLPLPPKILSPSPVPAWTPA